MIVWYHHFIRFSSFCFAFAASRRKLKGPASVGAGLARGSQTSLRALAARAFGAQAEEGVGGGPRPTADTFLSRTARMRAVLDEKTTFEKP